MSLTPSKEVKSISDCILNMSTQISDYQSLLINIFINYQNDKDFKSSAMINQIEALGKKYGSLGHELSWRRD